MQNQIVVYGLLLAAIVFEVLGASFLEKADGLSHVFPFVVSLFFYGASFVTGAYILKVMPLAVMYAVWTGVGVVLTGAAGYYLNHQRLDAPALAGILCIAIGVMIIYCFSKNVSS